VSLSLLPALAALARNGTPLTLDALRRRVQHQYVPAAPQVLDLIDRCNEVVAATALAANGHPVPPSDLHLLNLPPLGGLEPIALAVLIRGVGLSTPETRLRWLGVRAGYAGEAPTTTTTPFYSGAGQAGPSGHVVTTLRPEGVLEEAWVTSPDEAESTLGPRSLAHAFEATTARPVIAAARAVAGAGVWVEPTREGDGDYLVPAAVFERLRAALRTGEAP